MVVGWRANDYRQAIFKNDMFARLFLPEKIKAQHATFPTRVVCEYATRSVQNYNANKVCSLKALPAVYDDERFNMVDFQVDANSDNIVEHASRRVDLFYYQLISFFHLKIRFSANSVVITKDKTTLQHGKGSLRLLTHACHSAILPSVAIMLYKCNGVEIDITDQYRSTFFYQSLNSTVELPAIVNTVDAWLEGGAQPSFLMKAGLRILNLIANDMIDPDDGMYLFYYAFEKQFGVALAKNKSDEKRTSLISARSQIIDLERKGTFAGANSDLTMRDDYKQSLLRLAHLNPGILREDEFIRRYHEIADEIWNTQTHGYK